MSSSDLEAQATPRIREAIRAAIQTSDRQEFARLSRIEPSILDRILSSEGEFVPVAVVTLACQINKGHGDTDPARTSISECLKGAILRLPGKASSQSIEDEDRSDMRRRRNEFLKSGTRRPGTLDGSALRVIGYTANIAVFFVLGYFLGGVALGPLLGFAPCVGVVAGSPWLTPCAGSILGLIVAAILWLGYTYYYFVKKTMIETARVAS